MARREVRLPHGLGSKERSLHKPTCPVPVGWSRGSQRRVTVDSVEEGDDTTQYG